MPAALWLFSLCTASFTSVNFGEFVPTLSSGCSTDCRGWTVSTAGRFRSSLICSTHRMSISAVAMIRFLSLLRIVSGRFFYLLSILLSVPIEVVLSNCLSRYVCYTYFYCLVLQKSALVLFESPFYFLTEVFSSFPLFVTMMGCSITSNSALELHGFHE